MTTTNQQRGNLARQHGQEFEVYARKECRDLLKADRALVQKNWEAPTVPGEHFKREKSKPDFSGFLPDSRHVIFECKATLSKTSFPFSNITDHQWAYLDRAHTAGSISFLYVLDGQRQKWVVPWKRVKFISLERSSFPFADEVYRKRRGETWLDTWHRVELEGLT
ncbi:MAG: Holliday junction resolvase RecU [Persicimonas sp.]